ncbi:ATP-binding cassette subfamily B protein [Dongia mobilis]|uniref:ATP-binding cassette subfamily B protein n=1 Tax=Dongia mobilis TaxID=578943 RepID=A0A4R6WMF4_9PROT|nr:ABC transporter ATP-binding protein/permease [Dongia mobilis]TDQ82043.1 ATP-binding cassette subfamily B protein [Dongia mobilis]
MAVSPAQPTAAPQKAPAAPRHPQLEALRTLLPYLWPKGEWDLRARVIASVTCLIVAKLANVYVPILFKQMVDSLGTVAGTTATAAVSVAGVSLGLLLAYGAARVMSQAFAEFRDGIFAKVAQRSIRKVALNTFRHLHSLSLKFHLERQTGGLNRAIERGAKGIEFLLFFILFNVLPTLFEIGLVCIILWTLYDWTFAAVTFLTIAVYIWYSLFVTEWRIKFRREMNESDQSANTKAVDSLLNYETVKYFGNEEHEARRYDVALQAYEKAAVKSRTSLATLNVGQAFIIAAGLVLMMGMAARGTAQGHMTVGDFVLVNAYLIQLYLPLNFLGFVYREIRQSLIDMEAMFALLRVDVEIADAPGAAPLDVTAGEIRFENVEFGYDPRRPILKGVSFTVAPGRKLAIVGPSGAGKSTISRLLYRFYDVGSGRILIDGQDIRNVQQASLRAAIGIVPQDTVLFNDTVAYNIAYGRPGADTAEIENAARLAHIHDFVSALPDGYKTMVGERGLKLSGGEKQRVAIARTILKDPPILLFDEATSALDSHTEREIQDNLAEVAKNHTTLVIAHRLSTIIDADEIIVLDAGRVVERGRHDELLRAEGAYAAMWRRQQEAARREWAAVPAVEVPA